MTEKASSTFKITSWKEDALSETAGGGKLVRARVSKSYAGGLEGEGRVEYLMAYRGDGAARFVGYEVVTGSLGERSGSFVFEHRGTFEGGTVDSVWSIVEGSGTGDLSGLSGRVEFSAGHRDDYPVVLEYEWA